MPRDRRGRAEQKKMTDARFPLMSKTTVNNRPALGLGVEAHALILTHSSPQCE